MLRAKVFSAEGLQHLSGEMLYFAGTKGCSDFLNTVLSDRPALGSAGASLCPNDD